MNAPAHYNLFVRTVVSMLSHPVRWRESAYDKKWCLALCTRLRGFDAGPVVCVAELPVVDLEGGSSLAAVQESLNRIYLSPSAPSGRVKMRSGARTAPDDIR